MRVDTVPYPRFPFTAREDERYRGMMAHVSRLQTRRDERGAAMLVTLIIVSSLLGAAAVLTHIEMGSNRATALTRSGMTAEYCAEMGAERAIPVVMANYNLWSATMCANANEATCVPSAPSAEPALLSGINHDVDGDGVPDFVLYLRDDQDEVGSASQNYFVDRDQRVYIVATCIKFPDTPRQVKELVELASPGTTYAGQQGGEWSNNNGNP